MIAQAALAQYGAKAANQASYHVFDALGQNLKPYHLGEMTLYLAGSVARKEFLDKGDINLLVRNAQGHRFVVGRLAAFAADQGWTLRYLHWENLGDHAIPMKLEARYLAGNPVELEPIEGGRQWAENVLYDLATLGQVRDLKDLWRLWNIHGWANRLMGVEPTPDELAEAFLAFYNAYRQMAGTTRRVDPDVMAVANALELDRPDRFLARCETRFMEKAKGSLNLLALPVGSVV